jgi:hypothetical protein
MKRQNRNFKNGLQDADDIRAGVFGMPRKIEPIQTTGGLLFRAEVEGFDGLNNVDDQTTMTLADLTVLRNTDVDDRQRLKRRRGRSSLSSGNFHSVWSDGKTCLVVKDSSLYSVDETWSLTLVKLGVGTTRMSYTKINEVIFYTNGLVIGAVKNRADLQIPPLSVSAPSFKAALFPARFIEQHGARLYLGTGNTIWYTDALSYFVIDKKQNFYLFETDIRMIRSVGTGLYISDSESVWWYEGLSPKKSQRRKVSTSPAVMFSDTLIEADLVKPELQGLAAVWIGNGIHIGLPDGSVINAVQGRYEVPEAVYGAPLVRTDGNRTLYTCSLTMS